MCVTIFQTGILPAYYCCCYNRRSRRRSPATPALLILRTHKGRRSSGHDNPYSPAQMEAGRFWHVRGICGFMHLALPMWLIISLPPPPDGLRIPMDYGTVLLRTYYRHTNFTAKLFDYTYGVFSMKNGVTDSSFCMKSCGLWQTGQYGRHLPRRR